MKKISIATLILLAALQLCAKPSTQNLANNIVPKPVQVSAVKGKSVMLTAESTIVYSELFSTQAEYLNQLLYKQLGMNIKLNSDTKVKPAIFLAFDTTLVTHNEGYLLLAENGQVRITARDVRGIVNGIQTLLQLLPIEHVEKAEVEPVKIYDYPRFAYRGMHLDVVRHMFPVEFVKKYIDYLAFHKLNTLHWHLTDDQGWRIEVLSYPKLNSVGSWRNETLIGHFFDTPIRYDGKRYGGFYTREEVKDIIAYAAIRGIDIIPEVDIPGHSRATIAAYPEFGTRPDTTFQVATTWGMFNRQNNVLAPRPEVFRFLETIFGEVADLFPSEYIHLGGDECSKMWWKASEETRQFIKDNNLKDEAGLQTYFIQQVAKYIQAKGKKVVGWDEIIEGYLDTSTIIMSWRGEKGGIQAAKRNHHVIMTPQKPMYFNCYQGKGKNDTLAIHGYNSLDMVYNFNPVPKELSDAKLEHFVIGGQACMWTEYIPTPQRLEYMLFPRMTALSEILWTADKEKDFVDFKRRLKVNMIPRYQSWGSQYFADYERWTIADADKD